MFVFLQIFNCNENNVFDDNLIVLETIDALNDMKNINAQSITIPNQYNVLTYDFNS